MFSSAALPFTLLNYSFFSASFPIGWAKDRRRLKSTRANIYPSFRLIQYRPITRGSALRGKAHYPLSSCSTLGDKYIYGEHIPRKVKITSVEKIFEPYEFATLPLRCCSGTVLFYGALDFYRFERALRRKAASGNTP
jgi:hypothetical protein